MVQVGYITRCRSLHDITYTCTMYPLVFMQRAKPSDLKVAFHIIFRFEEEFLPYIMCNNMSVCMLDQTPPVAVLINW